jgi:hypothetical protein
MWGLAAASDKISHYYLLSLQLITLKEFTFLCRYVMPIDTDSDAWERGEDIGSVAANALEFLAASPDSAFRIREIADEILGTDFETMESNSRLHDQYDAGEIAEEEYHDQWEDGIPSTTYRIDETYLELRLRRLVEQELVEIRSIDCSESDVPTDEGVVTYYTYALV